MKITLNHLLNQLNITMSINLQKKLIWSIIILLFFGIIFWDNNVYALSCWFGERYELRTSWALLKLIKSPYLYLYGTIIGLLVISNLQLFNIYVFSKKKSKIIWFIVLWIIILHLWTTIVWAQNIAFPNPYLRSWDCPPIYFHQRTNILPKFMKRFSVAHIISWMILLIKWKNSKLYLWSIFIIIINIIAVVFSIYILIVDKRWFATAFILLPIVSIIIIPSLIWWWVLLINRNQSWIIINQKKSVQKIDSNNQYQEVVVWEWIKTISNTQKESKIYLIIIKSILLFIPVGWILVFGLLYLQSAVVYMAWKLAPNYKLLILIPIIIFMIWYIAWLLPWRFYTMINRKLRHNKLTKKYVLSMSIFSACILIIIAILLVVRIWSSIS